MNTLQSASQSSLCYNYPSEAVNAEDFSCNVQLIDGDYIVFSMEPHFNCEKSLTQKQLEYLRDKYDMDNLSNGDIAKFLAELSCLGIISGRLAHEEACCGEQLFTHDRQFRPGGSSLSLNAWVQHYIQKAIQAKDDMEPYTFYSKLADVMNLFR